MGLRRALSLSGLHPAARQSALARTHGTGHWTAGAVPIGTAHATGLHAPQVLRTNISHNATPDISHDIIKSQHVSRTDTVTPSTLQIVRQLTSPSADLAVRLAVRLAVLGHDPSLDVSLARVSVPPPDSSSERALLGRAVGEHKCIYRLEADRFARRRGWSFGHLRRAVRCVDLLRDLHLLRSLDLLRGLHGPSA